MMVDTGLLTTSGRAVSRLDSVRKLYGSLRQRYSLIVVDSPAVFIGQQTLTLAAAADETVLVVEAERTALADVGRARAALERRGASVLGMVMNKSRTRIPSAVRAHLLSAMGRPARAPLPPFDEQAPVGAREMLAIAFKHRLMIAAALLLPPLAALALLILLPKTYRAQSDIMVKTGREYMAQADGESAGFTAPTSTKQEGINSEIALLTSRAVAEATIDKIGLGQLYPDIVANPPAAGSVLDAAVRQFGRDLIVEPVKLSNVIATSFDSRSPAEARRVLDAAIQAYIDKHTQVFAGRRAAGYRDSIEQAMGEVRALEATRSRLKLDNGIYDIAAQRRAIIAQRVDEETRLQDANTRQAQLTTRLAFLTRARAQAPATTRSASTEKSDERVHANEALIDLRQQEASLSARLGDANPDLQRVRSQIATVEREAGTARRERTNTTTAPSPLRQQVDGEIVMAGAELASMGSAIDRLAAAIATRDAELTRLERADLELRNTELQIDVVTQNLKAMQGRYEQARADEQTEIARQVSVVQVAGAIASEKPVGPRKLLFGLAGTLGGVLLAGIVALVAILTSKTALTEDAAERRVGLPVLAVVPLRGNRTFTPT